MSAVRCCCCLMPHVTAVLLLLLLLLPHCLAKARLSKYDTEHLDQHQLDMESWDPEVTYTEEFSFVLLELWWTPQHVTDSACDDLQLLASNESLTVMECAPVQHGNQSSGHRALIASTEVTSPQLIVSSLIDILVPAEASVLVRVNSETHALVTLTQSEGLGQYRICRLSLEQHFEITSLMEAQAQLGKNWDLMLSSSSSAVCRIHLASRAADEVDVNGDLQRLRMQRQAGSDPPSSSCPSAPPEFNTQSLQADAESLQRVYGISFPDPKQLKEWKTIQEEAEKRDHRRLGKEQRLFFFHELSPGSCFFYPRGAHIYNTLVAFIREEYWKRGFTEVITPNMYNSKLWEISGHWQRYSDKMFKIDIEKEIYGLKPMNCPGHCLMFASELHSYKELPIRYADFGVLHRNELSGALSGLTRVRRFQQDDAHIFCREDQIREEIGGCLDFLRHVYGIFGFTFKLELSTRPEHYLGEVDMWDRAEKQLAESLDASGLQWKLNPGDGAFYGPKIDVGIQDALKRWHQCATIQLDFQLPQRFDLRYQPESVDVPEASWPRPVIIHRAILGSVERMIAILTENCAGKWPFWLSPLQVFITSIVSACDQYATEVRDRVKEAGFMVDMDLDPGKSLNKKIRNAQLSLYNFILVVGAEEQKNGTVNVRTRDNKVHGEHSVDHVIARFREFARTRARDAQEAF